jgi:Icc protein
MRSPVPPGAAAETRITGMTRPQGKRDRLSIRFMSARGKQTGKRATGNRGMGGSPREDSTRVLRVLQLTDLHLFADPSGRLLGQNTRKTLDLVIELAVRTHWPVDRLLLTGDLVHDESVEGYRYLTERIAELGIPSNSLPGNHDAPALMSDVLDDHSLIGTESNVRLGAWNLVFLDSTIPKEEGGHLDAHQLDALRSALAAHPRAHALICLHHQPIPVGSLWMDTMALDNPGDFFSVIDEFTQVRGVVWGHVHQEYNGTRNGVALLGSPSTCIQFLPHSRDFAVDSLTPGFRWLHLHPDGRIETGIERIAAYPEPMDLTSGGY